MRCHRLVIPMTWWACWLIVCVPGSACRASDYGRPGEEFIGIRYPLQTEWTVESNPAFLPNADRNSFQASFFPQFESIYKASVVMILPVRTTVGFPKNRSGSASAGLIVHHLGVSDVEGRGPNNEPLGSFSDSRSVASLLIGVKLNPFLAVGGTLKFVNFSGSEAGTSELVSLSKSSFGTDVGMAVTPSPWLDLGLSISNAPLRPDMTLAGEREKWPMVVHLDSHLRLQGNRILVAGGTDLVQNDLRGGDGWVLRPEFGLNWRVHPSLVLGAGYANDEVVGGIQLNTSSASLQYSLENSDLGLLHYVSVGFSFGTTGEERYASGQGRK